MNNTIKAIQELIRVLQEKSEHEPDDFNYWLMKDLQIFADKTLYHLSRGSCGLVNNMDLNILKVDLDED